MAKVNNPDKMEVVKVTEPSKYSFWAILLTVILIILGIVIIWRWLFPPSKVGATLELPTCGTETYYFYNEGSNSRVAVNVHNSDEEIDVTGQNGWSVSGLWLDQTGGSTNYISFGSGNKHDYNPSSFGDIDKVKVEVTKACPTPTPTPTPEPTPPVCDEQSYTCGECEEKPNDDWCGEYKYGYCKEYYSCGYSDDIWACECPIEPTPTPEPTSTPQEPSKPTGCTENCGVPACTDSVPKPPDNPNVYRKGDTAIVRWWNTEGDKANIYYKHPNAGGWEHSVQVPNSGSAEINSLGTDDWTFAVQQVNGCAAGGLVSAISPEIVDGATTGWVLFR